MAIAEETREQVQEREGLPWTAVLHEWVTTVDHKKIGIMYVLMAVVFLVVGGCEALLVRWQLFWPRYDFLGPDVFNQMFTMHGTTMVFFMGMPILIGSANYLVPLMIGARDMAFPRLNALGFWVTLFGGLLVYFSFATGGAPAIGWFAYSPLTERTFARSAATDFWALGLMVSGVGTIAAGVNFIATILAMRAPGMALHKVPFFVWTMLWTSVLIIFALPPLTAGLAMVLLDRNLGAHFFDAQNGGSALLVAAHLLVLRPSGGVHPDPAGLRHGHRDHSGLLPQGAVRLRVHGGGHRGHRLHQPRRLGAPHVHRGHEPDRGPLLRRVHLPDLHSDRHQVLQLAGHDVRRADLVCLADALLHGLPVDVPDRRPDRHHAGGGPVRFSAAQTPTS